jgi:glycosyltransferase involved in cell wall biosynthesis
MFGKCGRCIGNNIELRFKTRILYKINTARKKAINRFMCPSEALTKACNLNGLPTVCINNPFDMSIVKKDEMAKTKVFLYYGRVSSDKGVSILVKVFSEFQKGHPDAVLWIIGSVSPEYKDEFSNICSNKCIEYKGCLKNKDIMELYRQVYCVAVPSLWLENYPNTVLEAIANKTLVIGSNRGGIPELIGNDNYLFNVLDEQDILKKLSYAYGLDTEEYIAVTNLRYEWMKKNNSLDRYYETLNRIYMEI